MVAKEDTNIGFTKSYFILFTVQVSHILGVFPQIGSINVEIVREDMFR